VLVERTAKEVVPALENNFEHVCSSLINWQIFNLLSGLCVATKNIQEKLVDTFFPSFADVHSDREVDGGGGKERSRTGDL
jgi:hypothetical protein